MWIQQRFGLSFKGRFDGLDPDWIAEMLNWIVNRPTNIIYADRTRAKKNNNNILPILRRFAIRDHIGHILFFVIATRDTVCPKHTNLSSLSVVQLDRIEPKFKPTIKFWP